ncbi:MAG: hypothetical protein ABIF01_00880, partial [Candidatus Micrarchaeota archaeon]
SHSRYPEDARYVSQDEIDYLKKAPPLSINEIKDLDSLLEAIADRVSYAGNKVFGNSASIEKGDNCSDSFFVYDSHTVLSSKYVALSAYVRSGSEYIFGSSPLLRGKYLIRVIGAENLTRAFETYVTTNSSDMFFSMYCHGCSHIMFSFNQKGKRHVIGNLELPKERYFELRKKLISESREHIEKHKSFYSIFDFPPPTNEELGMAKVPKIPRLQGSMKEIDDAFADTTRLILGEELRPIKKYEKFLTGRVEKVTTAKSPFGNDVSYAKYFWGANAPKERMVTSEEGRETGKIHVRPEDLEGLTLEKMIELMAPIAYYPVQFKEGKNINTTETVCMYHSIDTYQVSDATYSKKCAYCVHMQECEDVFGSGVLMVGSTYSIRCYDCVNVTMCMDLDSCKNCHRCMLCHNCEGLSDCMFCFNAKSLRYAIGNVEVGKERYERIRKMIVGEMLKRIEREGDIGFDICSLGSRKKH